MDLDEHHTRQGPAALALAAAAAERVLPVYLRQFPNAAELCGDALRLVWYHAAGAPVSKQEVARLLNQLLERIPPAEGETRAAALAGQALVDALEVALHGTPTPESALRSARAAVAEFFGEEAGVSERVWQEWAADRLSVTPERPRDALRNAEAPRSEWLARLQSDDLPLFRGGQ